MVLAIACTAGWFLAQRAREPACGGRTLTQWLLNTNKDFVWMPNDVYGHIHDELWDRVDELTSGTNATTTESVSRSLPDERTDAVRRIGTNGIPTLIHLLSARMSGLEKLWSRITDLFPAWMPGTGGGYAARDRVERQLSAASDGFTILGSSAESALPALSNLLFRGTSSDQLMLAIASIGPKGVALLTNVLSWPSSQARDCAALALGLQGDSGKPAVPALLNCVERGWASYQVLGALGRIGCEDPRLVQALMRLLEPTAPQPMRGLDEDMAFLLLGLQGEQARAAAPLVLARYLELDRDNDPSDARFRNFYRRILCAIAPSLEGQLPLRRRDEQLHSWP